MRTVGLIFYEETDTAPALAAGAEAAAAEAEARGAGKEDPAPAQEKAPEDMTVTELRSFAAAHGIDAVSYTHLLRRSTPTACPLAGWE